MSQSFHCPNCGAPLDYDGDDMTIRCPYCSSSVIVPESLRAAPPDVAPHPPSLTVVGMDALLSQAVKLKEIAQLLRAGRKIEAIKVYRETFGVGLAEAKAAVEKLEAGQPLVMPGSSSVTTQAPAAPDAGQVRADIVRLVQEGNKIQAIKLYRDYTGAGLKEAKDAVEAFEAGHSLIFVERPAQPAGATVITTGTSPATAQALRRASYLGTWIGLLFGTFWLGFMVAMVSMFGFTGLVRLAAPLACPDGYVDAYGQRVFNYYDAASDSSIDGAAVLKCVDAAGSITIAHPLLVFVIMLVGPWLAGTAAVFVGAGLRALRLPGGAAAALVLAAAVAGSFAVNNRIPSEASQSLGVLFLGRSDAGEEVGPGGVDIISVFVPTTVPVIRPSPTPGLVDELWSIGGEGIGPGFFTDARYMGIDGSGKIYVGEHVQGSRVQVFDAAGNFISQWNVDDAAILTGLAADRMGNVYVLQVGDIYRYDGASGERLGTVAEGRFEAIGVTFGGELVAVSDEAIVWFDGEGEPVRETSEPLEETVGESLSVANVAVDGQGNVYVISTFVHSVFKFSPEGKFLDRFGGEGDGPGQFRTSPDAIAVDGQGRIYVNDFDGIQVFDPNGGDLGLIPVEGYAFDMGFTDRNELVVLDRNAFKLVKYALNR